MRIPKIFFFLFCLAFSVTAAAQTDSNVVRVDSSMRRPGTKPRIPDSTAAVKKAAAKPAVVKDSARLVIEKMPRLALRRSLIIPGWGQLYNIQIRRPKKQVFRYIKLPIIYAGYVSLGLVYEFNQRYYRKTLREVQYRLANPGTVSNPEFKDVRDAALIGAKDYYRRNRDLCILGFAVFHTVQAIEAYTDAKLFRYNISDDLSMNVVPVVRPGASSFASSVPVPALKLTMRFK